MVNVQPAKIAKFFNLKNFRLYSICLCREAIQSQRLPSMLYVNLIATYISLVRIIRAYNIIDDIFHTGWINLPGMEKIIYIVCTSKSKTDFGYWGFFVTFFFSA